MKAKWLAIAALALCGCAAGIVRSDYVAGVAVGHGELEVCAAGPPRCEAGVSDERDCKHIKGGYFSTGFAGFLEAAVSAVAAYFGGGNG